MIESIFIIVGPYSVKIMTQLVSQLILVALPYRPYAYFSLQWQSSVRKLVEILPQQERFLGEGFKFFLISRESQPKSNLFEFIF